MKILLFDTYRAEKKLSSIGSWENNKKAAVEAELKAMEVYFTLQNYYYYF